MIEIFQYKNFLNLLVCKRLRFCLVFNVLNLCYYRKFGINAYNMYEKNLLFLETSKR